MNRHDILKEKRSLSGIYFRFKNGDKYENRVFEDLPELNQDKMMEGRSEIWLKSLCKQLANTIIRIAEEFDITAEKGDGV